jgi:hypothetical protein
MLIKNTIAMEEKAQILKFLKAFITAQNNLF